MFVVAPCDGVCVAPVLTSAGTWELRRRAAFSCVAVALCRAEPGCCCRGLTDSTFDVDACVVPARSAAAFVSGVAACPTGKLENSRCFFVPARESLLLPADTPR